MQTSACFHKWKQKKVYTFFMGYCLHIPTTYYYSKYPRFVNHISAFYPAIRKETSIIRTILQKYVRTSKTHLFRKYAERSARGARAFGAGREQPSAEFAAHTPQIN